MGRSATRSSRLRYVGANQCTKCDQLVTNRSTVYCPCSRSPSSPGVVNSRPMTITCSSHLAMMECATAKFSKSDFVTKFHNFRIYPNFLKTQTMIN